jgi:hypothetical protein
MVLLQVIGQQPVVVRNVGRLPEHLLVHLLQDENSVRCGNLPGTVNQSAAKRFHRGVLPVQSIGSQYNRSHVEIVLLLLSVFNQKHC